MLKRCILLLALLASPSFADEIPKQIVMVTAYQDKEVVSGGTGFIYSENDKVAYVATCTHVLRTGDIKIKPPERKEVSAKLIYQQGDLSVLEIPNPGLGVLRVSKASPNFPEEVFAGGYGPKADKYEVHRGPYLGNGWVGFPSRPGDSGGPIWRKDGSVVGLVSLSDLLHGSWMISLRSAE